MSEEKLFTLSTEGETDPISQTHQTKVFVKLYVSARTSGLIRELGDEKWRTLCVLSTFMDASGACFPSTEQVAEALGVTRETASRRLKSLCDFRWNNRAIVHRVKKRRAGGTWANNLYTILPVSQLSIFGGEVEAADAPCDVEQHQPCDVGRSLPCDANVTLTRSIYNENHKELDKDVASKPYAKYNARDLINYFCAKYLERYKEPYVPSYSRDGSLIKTKLLANIPPDRAVKLVDIVIDRYSSEWASPKYDKPTIYALCCILPNKASAYIVDDAVERREEAQQAPVYDYQAMKREGRL